MTKAGEASQARGVVRLAARREASFYRSPGRATKYHLASAATPGASACGLVKLILQDGIPENHVPPVLKCKKCWPHDGKEWAQ